MRGLVDNPNLRSAMAGVGCGPTPLKAADDMLEFIILQLDVRALGRRGRDRWWGVPSEHGFLRLPEIRPVGPWVRLSFHLDAAGHHVEIVITQFVLLG